MSAGAHVSSDERRYSMSVGVHAPDQVLSIDDPLAGRRYAVTCRCGAASPVATYAEVDEWIQVHERTAVHAGACR